MRTNYITGVVLLIIAGCYASKGTSKQDYLKSLKEYHIFKPIQENLEYNSASSINTVLDKENGLHAEEATIIFLANDTRFELVLTLNKDLIPNGFSVSHSKENGELVLERPPQKDVNNCYYHGFVRGFNSSVVVANTCNGLRGSIFLPDDILKFEPVVGDNNMHVMYRSPDNYERACGNEDHESVHHSVSDIIEAFAHHSRLKRETEEKKFIELLLVADKKQFDKFGTGQTAREKLYDYAKEMVNYLDALFKKLKLRVVLLHVEVWDKEDKIASETDPQTVLNNFLSYRRERIQESTSDSPWRYTDNAQLLYGGSFDGPTVGMATVSSMCGLRSGGVNEGKNDALNTAATLAHEIGHNLGMSHDSRNCKCSGTKCVMASTSSSTPPKTWSDCSREYLEQGYKYGTANCLMNVPDSSRLFGGPLCGNGIVEAEEECDCGYPDECTSNCCNATTCQLLPDADCDDGACCTSDCRFKSSCSECRPLENDCDIIEYCTGHSAHCPGNIHKINGMDCGNNVGFCYGGVCRTHVMQCREVWGQGATNGDDKCYLNVNKGGNINGNCGKVNGVFRPCTPENAKCGKLQCSGGEKYPLIGSDRISYINSFNDIVCKTLSSTNDSSDVGDPGLVWDGTKCADGRICIGGVCENVTEVLKPCQADCNNHGVCNNFGNCHCDAGWAPPYCSRKGNGGSGDSGPICVSTTDMQVVLMLVFFLVILPIILALIAFIWWRYCGGRPKMYAWRKNRNYRRGQAAKKKSDVKELRSRGLGNKPNQDMQTPALDIAQAPTRPDAPVYPMRPPPPSRPSPSLPVRGPAPPRPPANRSSPATRPPPVIHRSSPARPAPVPNYPPAAKPTVAVKPIPIVPKPVKKPDVSYRCQPDKAENGYSDRSEPSQGVSIHDRIAQLQKSNFV